MLKNPVLILAASLVTASASASGRPGLSRGYLVESMGSKREIYRYYVGYDERQDDAVILPLHAYFDEMEIALIERCTYSSRTHAVRVTTATDVLSHAPVAPVVTDVACIRSRGFDRVWSERMAQPLPSAH